MSEYKPLTDEEVSKVCQDVGFEVIGVKHFEKDTFYYLKDLEDD